MIVTLHALALILLPLATLVVCVLRPRKIGRLAPLAWLLLPLVAGTCSGELIPCLCFRPHAITQVMIPAACLAFSYTCIGPSRLRAVFSISSLLLVFILPAQQGVLVGFGRCTTPELARADTSVHTHYALRELSEELREIGKADHTLYPAGWLRELPIHVKTEPWPQERAEYSWHTWITWLYRRVDTNRDFWFPGGTLVEAADKIELRERPDRITPSSR